MNRRSLWLVLSAYALWGVLPLYWHFLTNVDAFTILANRILWSAVFTVAVLAAKGRLGELKALFQNKAAMRFLVPAAFFVTVNWGLYIWAVNAGHVVDASLGYYMNPLVVFVCGMLVFRERCTLAEGVAIALACVGVLVCTLQYGAFPVIATTLAVSFALYGTLKKFANVGGLVSIAAETLMLLPFALLFLAVWPGSHATFAALDARTALLLIAAGPVTAIPLALYSQGVHDLPFTTMGFLQYVCPTLMLAVGVLFLGESLTLERLIAFCFIWAGLAIYSWGLVRRQRTEEAALNREKAL